MAIGNRLRRKLNRPIKFNHDDAVAEARFRASLELSSLRNPAVLEEVQSWVRAEDPATDGICCDRGIENADMEPGWMA